MLANAYIRHQRGLLQLYGHLPEVRVHHPNGERQNKNRVKQNKTKARIKQRDSKPIRRVSIEKENWDDYSDGRQKSLRENPKRQMLSARMISRNAIARARANPHAQYHHERRHHKAILQTSPSLHLIQSCAVVDGRRVRRKPYWWVPEVIVCRLDRCDYDPIQRREKKNRESPDHPESENGSQSESLPLHDARSLTPPRGSS